MVSQALEDRIEYRDIRSCGQIEVDGVGKAHLERGRELGAGRSGLSSFCSFLSGPLLRSIELGSGLEGLEGPKDCSKGTGLWLKARCFDDQAL